MNRFGIIECIKSTSMVIVVAVLALIASMPTFNTFAAPQDSQKDRSTVDHNAEDVELAELRLS
ncbi:MAG: hypothetical protein ABI557_21065, partial [Aureliella sp.]